MRFKIFSTEIYVSFVFIGLLTIMLAIDKTGYFWPVEKKKDTTENSALQILNIHARKHSDDIDEIIIEFPWIPLTKCSICIIIIIASIGQWSRYRFEIKLRC